MEFDEWGSYVRHLSTALSQMDSREMSTKVEEAAETIAQTLRMGGRVAVAGNGGSSAEADHFAGELAASFTREREALNVISLNSNIAALTAWANDYEYESFLERQVDGLLSPGDCLVLLTTSGTSRNVLRAARRAKSSGRSVVVVSGQKHAPLHSIADVTISVAHWLTPTIQEVQLAVIHYVCARVEGKLFPNAPLRYSRSPNSNRNATYDSSESTRI